jgi:hypothetical protein
MPINLTERNDEGELKRYDIRVGHSRHHCVGSLSERPSVKKVGVHEAIWNENQMRDQ